MGMGKVNRYQSRHNKRSLYDVRDFGDVPYQDYITMAKDAKMNDACLLYVWNWKPEVVFYDKRTIKWTLL